MPAYPYSCHPQLPTTCSPWPVPGPAPGTVTCADANANANAMTWLWFLVRVDPCLEDPSVRVAGQRIARAWSCGGWKARKAQRLGGRPAVQRLMLTCERYVLRVGSVRRRDRGRGRGTGTCCKQVLGYPVTDLCYLVPVSQGLFLCSAYIYIMSTGTSVQMHHAAG